MLTVALRRDRVPHRLIASGARRFILYQLAAGQKHLLRHFGAASSPGEDAFAGVDHAGTARRAVSSTDALAFLRCEVAGHLDGGDHRVFLARVAGGGLLQPDAEPMVHVRKSGLHY